MIDIFKAGYRSIVDAEIAIMLHLHIDPFTLGHNLSIIDFQFYVKELMAALDDMTDGINTI